MKSIVITIRDIVAQQYSAPTIHASKGSALRAFQTEVNRVDENNNIYKYPNDFEILAIATFNDETAEIQSYAYPESLGLARDYQNND